MSAPPPPQAALNAAPPLLLLAAFTFWCGTFAGAARFTPSVVGALLLIAAGVLGAVRGLDLLAVGRLAPTLVLISAAGSLLASDVPRAGWEGLALLPALLLLPGFAARFWSGGPEAAWASRGMALLVLLVSLYSLATWQVAEATRPALPLGHHALLGVWLVGSLPLVLPALRGGGAWRLLGVVALLAGLTLLVLSRSLAAGLGLVAQILVLTQWRRSARVRLLGGVMVAVVGLLLLPRLLAVQAGSDPSWEARRLYLEAGWRGFLERPLLGHGPGSSRWLLAETLHPEPGLLPPSQVVTDLHSLPVQVLFELGANGAVWVGLVVLLFAGRRIAEIRRLEAPPLAVPALYGLLGLTVATLFGRATVAPALPVLALVLAGAALPSLERPRVSRGSALYVAAVVVVLARPWLAAWHYERAVSSSEVSRRHLEAASDLDPEFPLYAARSAWLLAEQQPGSGEAARLARRAAERARGLAPLWLTAGLLGQAAAEDWGEAALQRACELDPLAPLAPFALATAQGVSSGAGGDRAELAARALLADPILAAAVYWDRDPRLLERALERARDWEGVEDAWRAAFLDEVSALRRRLHRRDGRVERLARALVLDGEPSTSLSLHAFRRPARVVELGSVEVWSEARELTLAPATVLPETAVEAFPPAGCRAPATP